MCVRQDPKRSVDKAYVPIRRIGKGSYGTVHEVESVATGRRRALKMIEKTAVPRPPLPLGR